jgi:ParB family chromosome partitioning protein
MASRNDFDDFFGDDEDTTVVDTRADGRLYRVPLSRLAANLVNPREDFGTEDQLIDLGKSLARRQIQACPVVSRVAYLKLWPDHADHIGDVDYVLVSGERRFRAATLAGLNSLNCVADDNVATDRKTFLEAVVSENVDRQNFDPVEEAYAVQALVAEFGSNRAVAQHFDRVDGWVTQRVLLTHLAREVQDLVRKKAIPLDAARSLGKLARDKAWGAAEQLAWWEEEQERRAAAAAARAAARRASKTQADAPPAAAAPEAVEPPTAPAVRPESFTAVKHDPVPEPVTHPSPDRPAGPPPQASAVRDATPQDLNHQDAPAVPAQPSQSVAPSPTAGATGQTGKRFPYDDGWFAGQNLIRLMPPGELKKCYEVLGQHLASQTASAE